MDSLRKIALLFGIAMGIMGIVFAAGSAHSRLNAMEGRIEKKVNTERYEADMNYVKESLFEIKSLLKERQGRDD